MLSIKENESFPKGEYDQIERFGKEALLKEGIPAPGLNLREYASTRRTFDLVFDLPDDLRQAVSDNLLVPTRKFFEGRLGSEQIFYNEGSLHTTFFQILTSESEPNYNPEIDQTEEYIRHARLILASYPPFEISYERFLRFPGSPGGIMLGGILPDNRLNQAREQLKAAFNKGGLRQYRPRDVKIAHITLMRDLTHVGAERSSEILDFIQQLDQKVWWAGRLDRVNLQTGNYFMDPATVEVIQTFELGR